jgi:hypothetical protein
VLTALALVVADGPTIAGDTRILKETGSHLAEFMAK